MKHTIFKKLIFLTAIIVLLPLAVTAQNPIIQTNYTADPAPMVYDGTVYLYTTHDEDVTVNQFFTMNDWRCYSSKDMVNWTDYGAILSYKDFSWARGDAWAGQCIHRNGKFYFYVPMNMKNGGNAIGVAVADSPIGPFRDALGKPLLVGYGYIDPTVYIDDDGQAYLYWGNPDLWYVKLNEDMISYNPTVGIVKTQLTPDGFGTRANTTERNTSYEEGPWFFKRDNKYYLMYPAGGVPEVLAYSTSPGPTGPWTYGNVIMNLIPDKGAFTNHPGYIDYKGKSYLFYHNAALPDGGGYKRSVCVDEFSFNSDGSISLIAPTAGIQNAVENVNPYLENQAETIAWEEGVKTDKSDKTGVYVTSIDNGDYIKVRNVDFGQNGAAAFTATVACETGAGIRVGGSIEIRLDNKNGNLIGSVPVLYTGGWDKWVNKTTGISMVNGVHDVYFVFKTLNSSVFIFDKWVFTPKQDTKELVAINAYTDKYKIDILDPNDTTTIKVDAIYSDGSFADVTTQVELSYKQGGVLTIDKGVVRGIAYGSESVVVKYEGMSDELRFVVKNLDSELTVDKVVLEPEYIDLLCGNTASIAIYANFLDGHTELITNQAVLSNPNPAIATVSDGLITARSKGQVVITANFKGAIGVSKSGSIAVNVYNRSPYVRNETEDYSNQSGIQTETCNDTDGGQNIGFIENGDWVKYQAIDFDKGTSKFEVRVASAGSGGNIEIRLNSPSGTLVGKCQVTSTGNWQNWETKSCIIEDINGNHDVYLVFTGGSGYLFNMNWWKFYALSTSNENLENAEKPIVVSKNNSIYLVNLTNNDFISVYNALGQKVNTIKASGSEERLSGFGGYAIIEIRRGFIVYVLKTIL